MNLVYRLFLAILIACGCWWSVQYYRQHHCESYQGMNCRQITPKQILGWRHDPNLLLAASGDKLQIQEDIGGQGGYLRGRSQLNNNYVIRFDFRSWSESSSFSLATYNQNNQEMIRVALEQSAGQTEVKVYMDGVSSGQTTLTPLNPDLFYEFRLEKTGQGLKLYFDGGLALEIIDTLSTPTRIIEISLEGQPYKPAGIDLRHLRLYE